MKLFHIRAATEQDELFLWDVLSESLFEHTTSRVNKDEREEIVKKYVAEWGKEGDLGFIAENESGEPLGAVTIRYFTNISGSYGYVAEHIPELTMAIKESYRGQGIGTALLTTVFDELKRTAVNQVSLCVHLWNEAALTLYYRFGFVETKVGEDAVIMVATLW